MNQLLTRQQVAELLQVPVATLERWAHRKEGPPYSRIGRHARYDETDVQRWNAERKVKVASKHANA